MKYFNINSIILIFITLLQLSCTESYDLKSKNFQSLLVVEATITNELKRQEIKLSRTYKLDSVSPIYESNAIVWVEDSNQVQYEFNESSPGVYTSSVAFQAESNNAYTLKIITSNNQQYQSSTEVLPPVSTLESIVPIAETKGGVEGVQLYVGSSNSEAQYFRYEYIETYKIVVPYYSSFNLVMTNVVFENGYPVQYFLERILKPFDVSTCYSNSYSTDIILNSLANAQGGQVIDFPVYFLTNKSLLRDRYSILIKQYVQSYEAHNFYKILKDLGTVENLFIENQPGFIQGNIISLDDSDENVIGFFQISTVSEKRTFFNYEDFYSQRPDYYYECILHENLDYTDTLIDGDRSFIFSLLDRDEPFKYVSGEPPYYTLVNPLCGDCTSFSSTEVPEFWEE